MNQENLIYLISQPRSGSTLTQKLLGSHNKIYTRSEPWIMLHPSYALKKDGMYTEYNFQLGTNAFNVFMEDLPDGKNTYLQEVQKMYLNLYSYYLNNTNYEYFLDKTPRYYLIVDELLQIFPKANFLLLIRNPLAVLGSIINTWTKENWYKLSDYKHDLLDAIETNIDILDNKQNVFLVFRYEELLSQDEKTLRKILTHMDLDYSKDILNYNNNSSEKWVYGDQENVYKKDGIDSSNDNKWQQDLKNPQYWRVMYDYLSYIGKEKFEKLGYSFDENLEILKSNMPAETVDELKSKTFSLFSFLDDTRECLIENQKKQKQIEQKNNELKEKNNELKEKNQELEQKQKVIEQKNNELKEKNQELEQKQKVIEQKNNELKEKNQELEQKQKVIEQKNNELKEKNQELEQKQKVINKLELIYEKQNYKYSCLMDSLQNISTVSVKTNPIEKYKQYKNLLYLYHELKGN